MKKMQWLAWMVVPCLAGMLCFPDVAISGAKQGLSLCLGSVLPALLPFMVFTQVCLLCGIVTPLSRPLGRWMQPLFGCPGAAAFAFLASLACGYPTGARIVSQLYDAGDLHTDEACRAACLCSTAGPMYTLGVLGPMLGRQDLAWSLWLIQVLAAVLVAFRHRKSTAVADSAVPASFRAPAPSRDPLGEAISLSLKPMAQVCTYVILFSMLLTLGESLLLQTLPMLQPGFRLLTPVAELSCGLVALGQSGLPLGLMLPLLAAALAWGGLCVHAQSLALLKNVPLSRRVFTCRKAEAALLSAMLAVPSALLLYLPDRFPKAEIATALPYALSFVGLIGMTLLWLLFCMVSRLRRSGN